MALVAAEFSSQAEVDATSTADLMRFYLPELSQSFTSSREICRAGLPTVEEFQKTLRCLSLFYAAISDAQSSHFLPMVVTGNLRIGTDRVMRDCSPAFDASFLSIFSRFPPFLRTDPAYFSHLMYFVIEKDPSKAIFVAFSTIPVVFRNGWCYEESELWSVFLQHYVDHVCRHSRDVPPDSPHFLPIHSFFLHKLGLDYLRLAVVNDL